MLFSSLSRILDVWRQDRAELIELIRPGLAEREIQARLSNLPFEIPQEVYWLYQWRNGIPTPNFHDLVLDFIPNYKFLPLVDAIAECERVEAFRANYITSSDYKNGDRPWFPVLSSHDMGHFVVLGSEKRQPSSPVLFLDWQAGFSLEITYPDLTRMMSVVAECYELGAYHLETEVMDRFGTTVEFLREDREEVDRIRRKHWNAV